jgi:hypothetical protein
MYEHKLYYYVFVTFMPVCLFDLSTNLCLTLNYRYLGNCGCTIEYHDVWEFRMIGMWLSNDQ